MKKEELLLQVKKKLKVINRLSQRIIEDFDMISIHDFRVEIKKLRSFLRLAAAESGNKLPVLPNRMKTFYGYAGMVRNIQIHLQSVKNYAEINKQPIPKEYISILEKEKKHWQQEATDLMHDNDFSGDEEEIINNLPDKLTQSAIRRFSKAKKEDFFQLLLHHNSDESLHDMRKILKDLSYTWPLINNYVELPPIINNKESINLIVTLIGEFTDSCMKLNFLSSDYIESIHNEEEKNLLRQIAQKIISEKDAGRKTIEDNLQF